MKLIVDGGGFPIGPSGLSARQVGITGRNIVTKNVLFEEIGPGVSDEMPDRFKSLRESCDGLKCDKR